MNQESLQDRLLNGFCSWLCFVFVIVVMLWFTVPALSSMTKDIWRSIFPNKKRKKL